MTCPNLFKIFDLEQKPYICMVIATGFKSPLDNISQVECELEKHRSGSVIFDLFSINGLSSNRFIEAHFDGRKFERWSFRIPDSVGEDVKAVSAEYFLNNDCLDLSVLPNALGYLAKHGRI